MKRTCICIDLKSFYASVECVERGLDPFETNLVVADPTRSKSTICLAISPALKKLGVKKASRMHELPPGISYITAMPRMQLYIDYSSMIYGIYLRYLAPEDIHVYSIDECFIDATEYLNLYQSEGKDFARLLMKAVMDETGITATAGVGPNLYLAKIAMDIVAKHVDDHIGVLDEISFREKLWDHEPLTDFWMIGNGTARRLAKYGIYTMGDIARASITSEDWLFKLFGMDAELLIDHAWGYESCLMRDIKSYHTQGHSLSSGQVLMRNYDYEECEVIVREMTDLLVLDLVRKRLVTDAVTLYISYDHKFLKPGSRGSVNLGMFTSSTKRIVDATTELYRHIVDHFTGIRRVNIIFNRVRYEDYHQYDLFTDPVKDEKERSLQHAVIELHDRYGKNSVMKGSNLYECSNYVERNQQIGGHRA
ncbi:MAG: DNA repair protein [Dorea sp.]|nr:DNA repair protein [Dorea sp.]